MHFHRGLGPRGHLPNLSPAAPRPAPRPGVGSPFPAPGPHCAVCGGTSGVVTDDGLAVCRACILRLGDAARAPERLSAGERRALEALHGDVVMLVQPRSDGRCVWRWRKGAL